MSRDVQLVVGLFVGVVIVVFLRVALQDGDLWLMDLQDWWNRRRNR